MPTHAAITISHTANKLPSRTALNNTAQIINYIETKYNTQISTGIKLLYKSDRLATRGELTIIIHADRSNKKNKQG